MAEKTDRRCFLARGVVGAGVAPFADDAVVYLRRTESGTNLQRPIGTSWERAIVTRAATSFEAPSNDTVSRAEGSERTEGLTRGRQWMLGRVPDGHWDRRCHRVAYMRWLGQRLGYSSPGDWYGLKRRHFRQNFGGGLLHLAYGDSPLKALRDFMPERDWYPWLFCCVRNRFWMERSNRQAYMMWLGRQLGVEHPDDWYAVTKADFVSNAGGGMLHGCFGDSVSAAVIEYLPRRRWRLWRFASVPQGFWLKAENRVAYLGWLGKRLRIRSPEQWYLVTTQKIAEHMGVSLVAYYGYSMLNIMREYLPEFDWKPWLFRRVPADYWSDPANRRSYLAWLGDHLGFRRPSDWHKLTIEDVKRTGGASVFKQVYRGRLASVLSERYPNYPWAHVRGV